MTLPNALSLMRIFLVEIEGRLLDFFFAQTGGVTAVACVQYVRQGLMMFSVSGSRPRR